MTWEGGRKGIQFNAASLYLYHYGAGSQAAGRLASQLERSAIAGRRQRVALSQAPAVIAAKDEHGAVRGACACTTLNCGAHSFFRVFSALGARPVRYGPLGCL